ncbi:sensor histidine kinase [Polaromonas sp. P5_E6]
MMKAAEPTPATGTSLRHWAIVAVLLAAATGGGLLLDRQVTIASQAMLYVLVVVVVSYTMGWKESVASALVAVTALNYFFVPPRFTFEVESRDHLIAIFSMLLVALAISHLSARLRRETAVARLNEERARQLQGLATQLAAAANAEEIAALGQAALDEAFEGPCLLGTRQAGGELSNAAVLEPSVLDGMKCCMREAATLGPGTGRWPGLNAWYLPLGDKTQMHGAARVEPAPAHDTGGREHAEALCALLGQALWRLQLSQSMQAAQGEAQRQQVQSTFLAAISHDLRTPLATVVGAASALQTQGDKLAPAEQARLLGSIVSEASYLSTVTENTLQLVQLSNTAQPPARQWESPEEIVGTVLARVRKRDTQRRITSAVQAGLPLIKADPVLLAQLVDNLLDNALKYSTGAIELTVGEDKGSEGNILRLTVKDSGPQIAKDKYEAIFAPYARGDQSGPRGAGLGLALCRAIAEAHQGRLTLSSRRDVGEPGEGNVFTLTLPIEAQQPAGMQP